MRATSLLSLFAMSVTVSIGIPIKAAGSIEAKTNRYWPKICASVPYLAEAFCNSAATSSAEVKAKRAESSGGFWVSHKGKTFWVDRNNEYWENSRGKWHRNHKGKKGDSMKLFTFLSHAKRSKDDLPGQAGPRITGGEDGSDISTEGLTHSSALPARDTGADLGRGVAVRAQLKWNGPKSNDLYDVYDCYSYLNKLETVDPVQATAEQDGLQGCVESANNIKEVRNARVGLESRFNPFIATVDPIVLPAKGEDEDLLNQPGDDDTDGEKLKRTLALGVRNTTREIKSQIHWNGPKSDELHTLHDCRSYFDKLSDSSQVAERKGLKGCEESAIKWKISGVGSREKSSTWSNPVEQLIKDKRFIDGDTLFNKKNELGINDFRDCIDRGDEEMENRGKSSTGPDQMQQFINNKCSVDYDTLSTYKDEGWDLNYFRDCVESSDEEMENRSKLNHKPRDSK